jgi:hypothetical protein
LQNASLRAAEVDSRLWEISDMVKMIEEWEQLDAAQEAKLR